MYRLMEKLKADRVKGGSTGDEDISKMATSMARKTYYKKLLERVSSQAEAYVTLTTNVTIADASRKRRSELAARLSSLHVDFKRTLDPNVTVEIVW